MAAAARRARPAGRRVRRPIGGTSGGSRDATGSGTAVTAKTSPSLSLASTLAATTAPEDAASAAAGEGTVGDNQRASEKRMSLSNMSSTVMAGLLLLPPALPLAAARRAAAGLQRSVSSREARSGTTVPQNCRRPTGPPLAASIGGQLSVKVGFGPSRPASSPRRAPAERAD